MIDRDTWGHLYLTVRILGFVEDARWTTAKVFAKDVFIDQERKLGDRRRSDTALVSIISHTVSQAQGQLQRRPVCPTDYT